MWAFCNYLYSNICQNSSKLFDFSHFQHKSDVLLGDFCILEDYFIRTHQCEDLYTKLASYIVQISKEEQFNS